MSVLSDAAVDGTFTDDVDGVPEEHPAVQAAINMTDAQLAALQYATLATNMLMIESLVPAQKYNWQAFGAEDGVNGGPGAGNCAAWMRTNCAPSFQGRPMLMQMDNSPANANQTVAAFLVSRPPYAYLGWGWESDDAQWNDIFYLQVGDATGLCTEGPSGVFTRQYSAGVASLDCNAWTADLPFPTLQQQPATVHAAAAAVAASEPFCGISTARGADVLVLRCAPGAGVIASVDFAAYGTPSGSCAGDDLAHNASCDWAGASAWASAACVGQAECVLSADGRSGGVPDPCEGVVKTLAVVARCAAAPGGSALPIVPPCAVTEGTPPCPLPTWEPVWALNRSTICQPGGNDGDSWLDPAAAARWGLVSLDWSVANAEWRGNGNVANMTGAATLVEQCRRIKAVDPTTKCFVYRNTELALEWMEPHRAVMRDPAFAGYFLQYQPGNPQNGTPGAPYNEDAGGPGAGCRQFFWNYSNADAYEYVLGVSEQGALATDSEFVDGTFLDDSQAIPQEHAQAPANMGMSALQLLDAQNSTYRFFNEAVAALASKGKFIWQGFNGLEQGDPDGVGIAPTQSTCASYMETVCAPAWQGVPRTTQWPSAQGDKLPVLASFLVSRGPFDFVGFGWFGAGSIGLPTWDPLFDAYDVGEPTGACTQSAPGVFSRTWSKGTASLDCNTWTATLNF